MDDAHGREVNTEAEVATFSLPAQGEDRPCFVKLFLPLGLFSQYQSERDQQEITQGNTDGMFTKNLPRVTLAYSSLCTSMLCCHFNNHSALSH